MDRDKALEILGLPNDASLQRVEASFKRLAAERHPDRGGSHQEMAELNEARRALVEGEHPSNLPVVVGGLSRSVQKLSERIVRQAQVAREVQRAEAVVRDEATSALRSWRKIAVICAAVSTIALVAKDVPQALIIGRTHELELPATVNKPQKPSVISEYEAAKGASTVENRDGSAMTSEVPLPRTFSPGEIVQIEAYEMEEREYERYQSYAEYVRRKNEAMRAKREYFSLLWYILCVAVAASASVVAWRAEGRIKEVDRELDELGDELSDSSLFGGLLADVFSQETPASFESEAFENAVAAWEPSRARLRHIHRAVGPKKLARLIVARGLEVGFLENADSVPGRAGGRRMYTVTL